MGTATRMWSQDTYVNQTKPTTNYYTAARLGLRKWDAPNAQYAYITFSKPPFPLKARIVSATLTVQTYSMPESGTHTLNLARVTKPITYSRVTWNTRPDVDTANQISLSRSGAQPGGQEWVFDVKEMLQKVSDGAPWYGFRVTTGDDSQRWLYADETSSQSVEGPTLSIVWADNPDEPQSLSPNEGVVATNKPALSFEYVDISGDNDLQAVQIQTSTTTSFSSPSWDSGEYPVVDTTVYLSGTSYPGATAGQRVYYRMKVKDGGLWSGWSSVAWFVYQPQPSLTITSFDPSDPYFSETTPDLSWTSPGQTAYQVTIARTSNPSRILWNSGKVASTQNVIGIPKGVLRWDDANYRVIVRTWDNLDRVNVANALAYNRVQYDVRLDTDLALSPVTVYEVKQYVNTPYLDVIWDRATSADAFEIVRQVRDGEKVVLDQLTYAETHQSNGRHMFRDRSAPPNTPLRYIIRPVVNGKRGGGTPSDYLTLNLTGLWLTTPSWTLPIVGDDQGSWEPFDTYTAFDVRGASAPVVIRDPFKGYSGSIEGLLVTEKRFQPSRTAQERRDVFLKICKHPEGARLIAGDLNIPVQIAETNVYPSPHKDLRYTVSFKFWQDGEIWWDRL